MYPSPSGFFVLLLSWPLATGTHMSRSVRSPSVAATCGVAENDSRRRRGATTATASYAFVLLSAAGPAACRHRGNDGSPRRALTRPTLHFPTVSVEQPIDQPAPADRLTDNARRTLAAKKICWLALIFLFFSKSTKEDSYSSARHASSFSIVWIARADLHSEI
jgi:hypothetical protein